MTTRFILFLAFLSSFWVKTTSFSQSYRPKFCKGRPSAAKSFILGQKECLKPSQKKLLKKFHLLHLIVPSGLHLGFLCWWLNRRRKRKNKLTLALLFTIQFLPSFWALKRMALYLLSKELLKRLKITAHPMGLWAIILMIELAHGRALENLTSLRLSFLFFSLILLSPGPLSLMKNFAMAQILVAWEFQQSFHLVRFFFGQLYTLLGVFYFPFFGVDWLFGSDFFSTLFFNSLKFLNESLPSLEAFHPHSLLLLFIVGFLPGKLLFILLILFPFPTYNGPRYQYHWTPFQLPPPTPYQKKIEKKRQTQFHYEDGTICRSRFYPKGWSTRCRR